MIRRFKAHSYRAAHRAVPQPRWVKIGHADSDFGFYLTVAAAVFILMVVFTTFVGRMYVIPSGSMEPTLHGCAGCTNDRIAVERVSYYFSDPQPGDVIVFEATGSWNVGFEAKRSDNVMVRGVQNALAAAGLLPNAENILTKRVIATGGQTVSCLPGDTGVMVDGKRIDDSYILDPPEMIIDMPMGSQACGGPYFGPVTVPQGSAWVMGDNRTNSLDSRAHLADERQGTIPVDSIRGKVRFIVLPLSRFGRVGHAQP